MPASDDPTVVCVVGSARSGTSAVAHLIKQLGVELGPPEHLLMKLDWNTEGCWEHLVFLDVNEHLFRRFGGTGVRPPVFPPDWHLAPDLEDLRARVRRTVAADFRGKALWGWKDPTSCLTLPFWQDVLGPMHYIVCVRNPVDVTASMEKHWKWSLPAGMWSWLERNVAAVLYTTGQPRCFFSFDDYFQDPETQVRRLAQFLGAALPTEGSEAYGEIFGTVKPELRTFCSPLERVEGDERLTEGEKYFYRELLAACRVPQGGTASTERLTDAYRGAVRSRYQRLHGQFEAYANLSENDLAEARRQLTTVEAERDRLLAEASRTVGSTRKPRVPAGARAGVQQ